ncbi:MAG: hypothetical protein PHO52_07555 [Sulfuricurvum sp.]|nr:hypothetical protein [Sulfuricurvum sp.]
MAAIVLLFYSMAAYGFDLIGVGGYEYNSSDGVHSITELIYNEHLNNVNAISMWITRDWDEGWYPSEEVNERIIQKGFTPIFILYWFEDSISKSYIQKNKNAYYDYLHRIRRYLDRVEGKKIVVLNPEFNENRVEGWEGFNDILLESKKILDHGDIAIGPCVGDFGNYGNTEDLNNWQTFDPSIVSSISHFDFIAFQEMRALTRNKRSEIEKLPERIESFGGYLHSKYKKPVFLAYLALSSWGEEGEKLQEEVISRLNERQEIFTQKGIFGINLFNLIDVPFHRGYFNEGERFFGIYYHNLMPKPSVSFFRELRVNK